MDLTSINCKYTYNMPPDNVAKDVWIPALKNSNKFDCISGYFTINSFKELAEGLEKFINLNDSKFRLLISPNLLQKDIDALEQTIDDPLEVIETKLIEQLKSLNINQYALENFTIDCFAYLLKTNRLEIKFAVMKKPVSVYHKKIYINKYNEDFIVSEGSPNQTTSGITRNGEAVSVFRSWHSPESKHRGEDFIKIFEDDWNEKNSHINIYSASEAIKKEILNCVINENPDQTAYREAISNDNDSNNNIITIPEPKNFHIPSWMNYKEGDYEHQIKAIESWEDQERRGILSMATGSGKTYTSLIAAHRLYKEKGKLLIVIAVPYTPLMHQWQDDCELFGLDVVSTNMGGTQRTTVINNAFRDLKLGLKDVICIITSQVLIARDGFLNLIENSDLSSLIIADEAHHLGSPGFMKARPEFFNYRLGLSATIERYDKEETEFLTNYFGEVCKFKFELKDAIGKCLVPYDYFLHKITLTADETEEWLELDQKIKDLSYLTDENDFTLLDLLKNRRASITEQADNKIKILKNHIIKNKNLNRTLIYCSSKNENDEYNAEFDKNQLKNVNAILNENQILFSQLTGEETGKGFSERILNDLTNNKIQIITAMKVLDEGVDLPVVDKAWIMGSNRSSREWVQRRGRVLRISDGKEYSTIHDFFVLPHESYNTIIDVQESFVENIINREYERAVEFANLARNKGDKNGALRTLDEIFDKYILGN